MVTVIMLFVALLILALFSATVDVEESQINDWRDYIEIVCEERAICPELVEAIIERESNWNPRAVNGDCVGLMQINPAYQQERMDRLGVTDLTDPYDNVLVGVDYLAELFEEYEDLYAVLMYYNAGYNGLRLWRFGNYSDYAVEVATRAAELERQHGK